MWFSLRLNMTIIKAECASECTLFWTKVNERDRGFGLWISVSIHYIHQELLSLIRPRLDNKKAFCFLLLTFLLTFVPALLPFQLAKWRFLLLVLVPRAGVCTLPLRVAAPPLSPGKWCAFLTNLNNNLWTKILSQTSNRQLTWLHGKSIDRFPMQSMQSMTAD